jgi:hypothetical protein
MAEMGGLEEVGDGTATFTIHPWLLELLIIQVVLELLAKGTRALMVKEAGAVQEDQLQVVQEELDTHHLFLEVPIRIHLGGV